MYLIISVAVAATVILGLLIFGFIKLSRYAKRQLDTGGVWWYCKCSNPVCNDPKNHEDELYPPPYFQYILDPATPKCDICHIAPATKTNALNDRLCVDCK